MSFRVWLRGNWSQPCSFSLINRRLQQELAGRGAEVRVIDIDAPAASTLEPQPPDLYIFHGHPWDLRSAPGRTNLLILNYEYPRLADPSWIAQIEEGFDAVRVPSEFVARVLREAGLGLPLLRLPWGYDAKEFFPAPPLERDRPFTFITTGAANWRKGTDLLIEAFRAEFAPHEAVRLQIFEGLRHPAWSDWLEELLDRHQLSQAVPAIEWQSGFRATLADLLQQADCGVYPHRGEGFGLGGLECLACGTPLVVSGGSGSDDFCRGPEVQRLPTQLREGPQGSWLEPRVEDLRAALRQAFQKGRSGLERRREIAASVADFAWERCLAGVREWFQIEPRARSRAARHLYSELGSTSWRFHNRQVARVFSRLKGEAPVLVGESEASCEALRDFLGLRVVYRGGSCLEAVLAADSRERELCGVARLASDELLLWRSRREWELAQRVVLPSRISARLSQDYYEASKMAVLPLAFGRRSCGQPPQQLRRILFVASQPYRKGIRIVLEAWDRLRPRSLELLCVGAREAQNSPALLRLLVRNPNVRLLPWMSHRHILGWMNRVDLLLQPSLEDGFGIAVAEAMARARPAIVSDHTGISELLCPGRDGWVVEAGQVESLGAALEALFVAPQRIREAGREAWETAGRRTWSDYRRELRAYLMKELVGCSC